MERYAKGEILVEFKVGANPSEAEKVIKGCGLKIKSKVSLHAGHLYLIKVPIGSESKWIKRFKKRDLVKNAWRSVSISLPKTLNR